MPETRESATLPRMKPLLTELISASLPAVEREAGARG
ncbi:hypothetical protein Cadr_000020980 [Camelus dromedarius]|uniref:Uncharacterized protein n=1 Tax=Camelus dromedarius TaxID=9838 RepID=A0A5N4CTK0_CAMDR|nr:hypothetical protein Cadr_000020980 [Camelus dromedarius]